MGGSGASTFSVSVSICLIDRVSAGLGVMARAMVQTQGQADALNKKLASVKNMFVSGGIMVGAGMALATPLMAAVKNAAELEMAMKRVQVATASNQAQMAGFSSLLSQVSDKTAIFSQADLANFSGDMAASGIRSMKDIKALLPMFAQSADILKSTPAHTSPSQTAHTLAALAHQFGRYKPDEMKPIVNAATALAPMLPGGMKGFTLMGSYVNIQGSRLMNADPVKLMTLQAAAMQTSGGGGSGARGPLSGANISNALTRVIPGVFGSGIFSGKGAFALQTMGLTKDGLSTVFKDGKMNIDAFMGQLKKVHDLSESAAGRMQLARNMLAAAPMLGKKALEVKEFANTVLAHRGKGVAPAELSLKLFQWAFGAAGKTATAMSDEKFQGAFGYMTNRVKNYIGVDATQEQLMKPLVMQTKRLDTNLHTLSTTIGTQALPLLTKLATAAADWTSKVNTFMEKHPGLTRTLVTMTGLTSGLMILGGAGMIVSAAVTGLTFIMPILGGAIWPVVAAVTAVSLVAANWGKIMKWMKDHIDAVKVGLAMMVKVCPGLEGALKALKLAFGNQKNITDWLKTSADGATKAVGGLGKSIDQFMALVQGASLMASKSNIPFLNQAGGRVASDISMARNIAPFIGPLTSAWADWTLRDSGVNIAGSHLVDQPWTSKQPKQTAGNVTIHAPIHIHGSVDDHTLNKIGKHVEKTVRKVINGDAHANTRSITIGSSTHISKFATGGGNDW